MTRFVLALLLTLLSLSGWAQSLKGDHVEIKLITAPSSSPDELNVGVHFKLDPEWHVYWKNPGDSGAAPKFEISGAELIEVQWPYPVRIPVGHLTNFGYEHDAVFLLKLKPQQVEMTLNLEWLVCKVECIPGFGELKFTKETLKQDSELFAKFQARTPQPNNWKAEFDSQNESALVFKLIPSDFNISDIKNLFVYPEDGTIFQTALPKIELLKDAFKVSVPITANAKFQPENLGFTFVAETMQGQTISFRKEISAKKDSPSWLMGLLLAFLGGVILNLMPCVFPIIFLKAFGFLKEPDSAKIRTSSWAYSAGVVLTFFIFGALLTLLRCSGEAIGWGYQLQSPIVVYLLALLFFLMALNFYGFFEIGNSVANKAGQIGSSKFFSGSFGTGILAVLVASPCTAPFMGSALGLTLLLPAPQALLIFVSLGAGMAAPMLLLAYMPFLVNMLPRSGQWMVNVKQFLSFPLFGTAIWLLWILANQRGSDAVFVALISFLILSLGIWLLHVSKKSAFKVLSWIILIITPVTAIYVVTQSTADTKTQVSNWAAYDKNIIAEKRKTQAVFIDFTASWCITCQVNKKAVLDTDEIQDFFKANNVFLVRADWTNHDPSITAALAQFNRNSVPFYVFYNKMAEAQTLPEILTKDMIKKLIKGEEK